MTRQVGVTIQR